VTSADIRPSGPLRIRVDGDPEALRSLLGWLRHEDALRGRVRPENAPIGQGEMGGVLDALVVSVGSGGVAAVLAGSLSTWLSTRRSDVRITVTTESGRTVEADGKRVDPRALAETVEHLRNSEGPQQRAGCRTAASHEPY
jgi:hypothetical protein